LRTCSAQLAVQRDRRAISKSAGKKRKPARGAAPASPAAAAMDALAASWGINADTEGSGGSGGSVANGSALSLLQQLGEPAHADEDLGSGAAGGALSYGFDDSDVDDDVRALAAAWLLEGSELQESAPLPLPLHAAPLSLPRAPQALPPIPLPLVPPLRQPHVALSITTLKLLHTHPCDLPLGLPGALRHAQLLPGFAAAFSEERVLAQHAAIHPGCLLLTLTTLALPGGDDDSAPVSAADAAAALLRGACGSFFGRAARDWTLSRAAESDDGAPAGDVAHVRSGQLLPPGGAAPAWAPPCTPPLSPLLPWALHAAAGGALRCAAAPPPPSPGLTLRAVRCRVHGAYLPGVTFRMLPRGGGIELTMPRCAAPLSGCALFELDWEPAARAAAGDDAAPVTQQASGWAVLLASSAPLTEEAQTAVARTRDAAEARRLVLLLGHALHACPPADADIDGGRSGNSDASHALPLLRAAAGEALARRMPRAAAALLDALALACHKHGEAQELGVALLLRCADGAMRSLVLRALPASSVPWALSGGASSISGVDDEAAADEALCAVQCASARVADACLAASRQRSVLGALRRGYAPQRHLASAAARFARAGDDVAAAAATAALRAHHRAGVAFSTWMLRRSIGAVRVNVLIAFLYSAILTYKERAEAADVPAVVSRGVLLRESDDIFLSFADARVLYFSQGCPSSLWLRVPATTALLVLATLSRPARLRAWYEAHHDAVHAAHGLVQLIVSAIYVEYTVAASLGGKRVLWPLWPSVGVHCFVTLSFAILQPLSCAALAPIMLLRAALPFLGRVWPVWPTSAELSAALLQAPAAVAGYTAARARNERLGQAWRAERREARAAAASDGGAAGSKARAKTASAAAADAPSASTREPIVRRRTTASGAQD
jgi:hypothetical protein